MEHKDQQTEKEQMKLQYESLHNMKKESEQEYRKLERRLMDNCAKRKANATGIKNSYHKHLFQKLCETNEWLIENNVNMTAADSSGQLWFKEIDQIPFEKTNYDKSAHSPELKEVTNFIDLMQGEWIETYFPHWNKANDARIKLKQLTEKDKNVDK